MRVIVEEKEILVNSAWIALDNPDVKIVEFDTRSKYPEVLATADSDLYLSASENTLHKGSEEGPTRISFEDIDDLRITSIDTGRYYVRVVLVRSSALNADRDSSLIWTSSRS